MTRHLALALLLTLGVLDVRLLLGPRTVGTITVLIGTPGQVTGPGTTRGCLSVAWYGAVEQTTGRPVRLQELCVPLRALEFLDAEVVDVREPQR
jgi:hypothetical protein